MKRLKFTEALFEKYLIGTCSQEESEFVLDYLKSSEDDPKISQLLKNVWEEEVPPVLNSIDETKVRYQSLKRRIGFSEKRPFQLHVWYKAASVVLLMAATLWGYNYRLELLNMIDPVPLIVKSTSDGERLKVQLPDESIVWINAASKVSFPASFRGKNRTVYLSGEAFFEVKENPDKPFRVISSEVFTQVVGTSFNVKAYEEGRIEVTVATGKVAVGLQDSALQQMHVVANLEPNQRVTYNKEETAFSVIEASSALAASGWKDGKLIFRVTPLHEVLRVLERWYGVRFVVADSSVLTKKFTASFPHGTTLAEIVRALTLTNKLAFDNRTRHEIIVKAVN